MGWDVMSLELPGYITKSINNFSDKNNLTGKKKEKFLEACNEYYEDNQVPVYEPVGIIAAHSMCEPATQMTLRTKHLAGAIEVSVGSGIKRLEELVDARNKTKYPIMTIFIKEGLKTDKNSLENYLKQLIYKKLSDLVTIKEDLGKTKITVNYDPKTLHEYNLKKEDLHKTLKSVLKLSVITDIDNGFEINFKEQSLLTVRKYFTKLQDLGFIGVVGITDAIITEEFGENVIKTQGSNLKEVTNLEFVDVYRSYTNDIFEIHKVFGIEAARELLVREIAEVYKTSGIGVDLRHLLLLVDSMCYEGDVQGVVRTGIVSTKKSPFARAAFEQTEKVLFNSALYGEEEEFEGVVENVMAGLPINIGIGRVNLEMDFTKIPKTEEKK
jgi:DNA-directed RNA polymerase subunit A"